MWQFTDTARDLLRGSSYTNSSRVDVLRSGDPVFSLVITGGSVEADAYRPVRRNLTCTLTDPTGQLARGDVEAELNAYDCEIAVWRGVKYGPKAQPTIEVAPQGVFLLTNSQVRDTPEGLAINLTGQDRSMNYQGPMVSALAISAGTPVETAILRLLASRNPQLTLITMKTGFTCGPLLYGPDIDVWREAQDLAVSVGGALFHDRTGQAVLTAHGAASDSPVASYSEGDGLLLDVDKAEDTDTIKNVVVAESTNGAIRVVVEDDDTSSPTYAGGGKLRKVATLTSQHFASIAQAQQAASARLAYELGRSETVTFSAVPNPALDVDEVVTVNRARAGLNHRGLLVATLDMPLVADQAMQVGCRRSVLAQDGRIFEADTA